jgi:soluble lytic murein transglycosylase-like protein
VLLSWDVTLRNPYEELLEKYAKKYRLNIELVRAIAKVENGSGNPKARSHKDAVGVMQVRAVVLREYFRLEKKVPIQWSDNTIERVLEIPAVNIQLGCWLLAHMKKRYKGDIVKTVSRYNTGMSVARINSGYVTKVFLEVLKDK